MRAIRRERFTTAVDARLDLHRSTFGICAR
jgi:hypothetical protein